MATCCVCLAHQKDLFAVRAQGGDVRVVYSPLEAVQIAEANPEKQVVFFAIGFETTAPANAMAVLQAKNKNVKNFSVLVSHVRVPPAMEAILGSTKNRVQAFLAAGHVCAVMGFHEYPPLAEKYNVPIVVTGFEPIDLLNGLLATVRQLEVWAGGGRESVSACCQVRWQRIRATDDSERVPIHRSKMARHRHDPAKWMGLESGVPGI